MMMVMVMMMMVVVETFMCVTVLYPFDKKNLLIYLNKAILWAVFWKLNMVSFFFF